MKKTCKAIKLSISIFLGLFIILSSNNLIHAQNLSNSRSNILPAKVWSVSFSNNVDFNFVNSKYIYVKDIYGNSVDVELSVNPQNRKQVIVKPKQGKYILGKTYVLTICKGFSDENGNKTGQDFSMQFSIKKQLIDTADFKVQVNRDMKIGTVALNSTTLPNVKSYRVEGQDPKDDNVNPGDEAVVFGAMDNVNVYFYDDSGNQIGSCLVNIEKACDSQVVQIN